MIEKQTLKDQLENLEANNPDQIKKHFSFVITKEYKKYSSYYCKIVTYTDYGFIKNNKKYWFGRRTNNESNTWDYDDIIIILNTLKNSNYKFACEYCGKGMLGSPNKFLDPIDFVNWIIKNNYHFEKFSNITIIDNGYWRFFGNLQEYSCAFWFDIFDVELMKKISEKTGLKIKGKG